MQFFKFLWKVESFYLVTEWHAICNHREIFFTSWTFCQDVNSLNKNSVQFISHHLNKPNLESLLKQYYLTTVTLCVHVWWMNGVIQCDKNKYIYTSTNWFIFFLVTRMFLFGFLTKILIDSTYIPSGGTVWAITFEN